MLNEIYKVLVPSGIYICISHVIPEKREKYFLKEGWDWLLTVEKLPKFGVDASDKKADPKKFHYVYILTKQGSAVSPSNHPDEGKEEKEEKEDNP